MVELASSQKIFFHFRKLITAFREINLDSPSGNEIFNIELVRRRTKVEPKVSILNQLVAADELERSNAPTRTAMHTDGE
jgi:hypothetical protein